MSRSREESGVWIRRFHPARRSALRLACFPHAGGSASFYYPVSESLAPSIEVLAVQYPGRQDRRNDACIEDLGELADQVFAALRHWLDRPVALFGHSMGAVLAFEVARRLEADAGVVPVRLFASGRRAPSRRRDETVHSQDDDGIVAELQMLSGTDVRVLGDEDLLRMVLPAIRADYRAIESYRYQPGPDVTCPITALVGNDDPRVAIDEARAWREHTTGTFDLQIYSGGHFFLGANQDDVINAISADLLPMSALDPLTSQR
jgi:pyochelin biosynthetic protein PchC